MLLPSGQVCPVEETNQMSRKTDNLCEEIACAAGGIVSERDN